jgi:iron complex outermembrane recepter protein
MSIKFQQSHLAKALALAFGGLTLLPAAQAQTTTTASADQRVEITGSRLRRAETEGALPVTVIDRAAIEASGQVSVSELMREVTFSSFGNFKPQSGSSAQALSDIDLRGLGSNRTLVLLDGRRISKAPFSGQAQDLNAIPLAAVERIEILTDGASAIYGSDAIGGVVNIITRKNFNGMQLTYGEGNPDVTGGDSKEMSLLWGASGSKGRMFAGLSSNDRGMIFTRDQIGGGTQGVSSFGNNYRRLNASGAPTGAFVRVPNFPCNTNNFWVTTGNTCSFDFNAIAANEAAVNNKAAFANGEFNINDNWMSYASGSVSKVSTFGRYAPTPVQVDLKPTSPAYLAITAATPGLAAASPLGLSLRHRMAAAGARDSSTDATIAAGMFGVKGRLFNTVDIDVGARSEKYKYIELGKNYIVRPLLEAAITNGSYDIFNPFGNSADVLNSVKSTITRDDIWDSKEFFGTASMDLFKFGNRAVTGLVGFESRKEFYQDNYDPQSEAGIIEGSAGNSASGSRKVDSVFFEIAAPVLPNLELSLAGRQDRYNDSGSKFSPKVSAKWQPMKTLTLRSAYGEGFRAPTLDVLTQKPAFSADSVFDTTTCVAFGGNPATCPNLQVQVDATVIANKDLKPETSKQFSFGVVFDPVSWASISVDYYDTKIDGRITNMSAQTIINRTLNPALGAVPALFSVTRDPATGAITNVTRGAVNEGTQNTSGLDMSFKTDFRLGSWGRLRNNLQVSYVDKFTVNGGRNLIGDQGSPKYRVNLGNTWTWNKLTTNLAFNHIPAQPDDVGGLPTKSYTTANLVVAYKFPTQTQVTVGMLNLENKKPELIPYDGRPWNFYLYDALGRQVFVRLQQTF